jgi:hypothetical protein
MLQYARMSRLESDATFPYCLAAAAMDRLDAWRRHRVGKDRTAPGFRHGPGRLQQHVDRGDQGHAPSLLDEFGAARRP